MSTWLKIFILFLLLGLFLYMPGCDKPSEQVKLGIDNLIYTKGTFTDKFPDNFPDSLIGKSPELYSIWKDREILKINGRIAVFYFNERYGRKGYYKAVIDDSTLRTINQYLKNINFDDIYDSALVRKDPGPYLYDGYTFLFLLTDKKKTKDVESRDLHLYKKDFSKFSGLIRGLDLKLKLEKIIDTTMIQAEFDSLKYSIIYNRKDRLPRLKKIIKWPYAWKEKTL